MQCSDHLHSSFKIRVLRSVVRDRTDGRPSSQAPERAGRTGHCGHHQDQAANQAAEHDRVLILNDDYTPMEFVVLGTLLVARLVVLAKEAFQNMHDEFHGGVVVVENEDPVLSGCLVCGLVLVMTAVPGPPCSFGARDHRRPYWWLANHGSQHQSLQRGIHGRSIAFGLRLGHAVT